MATQHATLGSEVVRSAELFMLQVYALTQKNFTLLLRLRKTTLCELLCPVAVLILCAVIQGATTYDYARVDASRSLVTLADGETVPIPCRVFDSIDGRYGEGMPIPHAWCVPLLFAPTSPSTMMAMGQLARRNGFTSPVVCRAT